MNKRIVRKPDPIPKILAVIQEIEGFLYATALELDMVYHTIRLDPDAQRICIIIYRLDKFSYLYLPMGIAGLLDIFQGKMSGLICKELSTYQVYLR